MILDTSAVLSILLREPDYEHYKRAIAEAERCLMSAANFLETAIVLEARTSLAGGHELDLLIEESPIQLVAVTAEHAQAARRAWRQFGKGNHPAALNFGDCFAYALAKETGEPLLFKGNDFALTDIEAA
ncbi:MAG: type II toxin-antitoxin system VapC family toxin [bacterium]|nr:type II toxin-antitoxin system VapC family toxin [bacterium]